MHESATLVDQWPLRRSQAPWGPGPRASLARQVAPCGECALRWTPRGPASRGLPLRRSLETGVRNGVNKGASVQMGHL